MALEIEKKFLLNYVPEDLMHNGIKMVQGYMLNQKDKVVRIRIAGEKAFLTIKGKTVNSVRKEYEYPIPVNDAQEMLDLLCEKPIIEKTRNYIEHKGFTWEVDCFHGNNSGLMVAEIELDRIDQEFEKPDWIGKEVSEDPKYYNSNLTRHPFSEWDSSKDSF